MNRRIRIALAAQAYAAGEIRMASYDLAGCDHLVATRHGLFVVNRTERRLIAYGLFYGITIAEDAIYAFEACGQPRDRTNRGRIVRFRRAGDTIVAAEVWADGLDNGCHQLDFIGDRLLILDTYLQRIATYRRDGGAIEYLQPVPLRPDGDWAQGYVHHNSILAYRDEIMLLFHNGADATGKPSEIAVFDPDWRLLRRTPLAGLGCHSLAVLEDGTVLSCGSMAGELIGTDGLKVKICDMMTRGLSVDDTQIVVGGSAFSERELRDEAGGAIVFLDRSYRTLATLPMPAPPMEIRRIDGRDRSLSSYLAAEG